MAQFMENIGALIEYNGNPITLLDQGVKCINCKCGWRSDQGRSVNEGLWLAFVKTQWSSYVLKVRPPLWHKKMKTSYFLGNVMIWIKIVRLAVSSYHGAAALCDLFKELSFSAPVMPPRPPLSIPCNFYWVLPSTPHNRPNSCVSADQQAATVEDAAAPVLLHALSEASAMCCCWPECHTLTAFVWSQLWSNHWSKANMMSVNHSGYTCYNSCTHEWSGTDASWWVVELLYPELTHLYQ